jgi:hypothetical protein
MTTLVGPPLTAGCDTTPTWPDVPTARRAAVRGHLARRLLTRVVDGMPL